MLPLFQDSALLTRALTHRSYLNEHPELPAEDNERLEFLGDAVLDFIVGEWLFRRFPEFAEGRLTSIRSATVRMETLSEIASQLGLGDQLRLGKGEAESGGRARQSLLADAFEAVIGALYLDQGLAAVRAMLEPILVDEIDRILNDQSDRDAKSRLQEWSQATRNITPHYRTIKETGPDHAKWFTVEVYLGTEATGRGKGASKQLAAQAAAADALKKLEIRN
ncbi:MAG TPA: ribonuclease III [Anaerolineae bacterium]